MKIIMEKIGRKLKAETKEFIRQIDRPSLLLEVASFDRIGLGYDADGYVCSFLSEGMGEDDRQERIDLEIAYTHLGGDAEVVYPGISLPDFWEQHPEDHAAARALAKRLSENGVEVPPLPGRRDEYAWGAYMDQLLGLLEESDATMNSIKEDLLDYADDVDYEELLAATVSSY